MSALGDFGDDDELGGLAGGGSMLAYQHGDEASVVGGPECPSPPGALIAVSRGGLATGAGRGVEIRDPATCGLVRSLTAAASVRALAVGDDLLAVLTRSSSGRERLERFRISTGARLGARTVARGTLPVLVLRGAWLLSRAPNGLRVLSLSSGQAWTVWRPATSPVGAGLAKGRVVWAENHGAHGRLWSLELPTS